MKTLNSVLLLLTSSLVSCKNVLKPNIVMFLTDDQDVFIGGMNPMKNVQSLMATGGITFTNAFVASPICCPSRASILTGLYPHNHHTVNNSISGGCYDEKWRENEKNTFASILQRDGQYETFYAGKYLNQYGLRETGGPERVPPGWSEWHGLVGNSVYYNYVLSNNGIPTASQHLYLTDTIRDISVSFIENQTESKPFLMVLAPPAPHAPFTPAPRHKNLFQNATVHKTPNFNIKSEDKHWLMRMPPSPLPKDMLPELDLVYRSRWEALLAVDEMVSDVIYALDNALLLDNTHLIFTSDNGYHIGQFSQAYDKRQPYESDIRVPLIIKGPGVLKDKIVDNPVMNIDLAPTILSLAGLEPPEYMDGVAINLFEEKIGVNQRVILVEYYGEHNIKSVEESCPWKRDENLAECKKEYDCKCQDSKNNTYSCIRQIALRLNYKYCKFDDKEHFTEIYDLAKDPYELKNIVQETLPGIKNWFKSMLEVLKICKGSENCNRFNNNSRFA